MIRRLTAALLASLMLAGCVTTGKVDPLATDKGRADAVKAYIQLGLGYVRQGNTQQAKIPLKQALEIDSSSAEAYAALGLVFQIEKEPQAADEHYRKALSLSKDPRILNNYGSFLYDAGRYAEAYQRFQEASGDQLYPERSRVFENLGLTSLKLGRKAEAKDHFEKSLVLDRREPRVLFELATLAFDSRDYVESRNYFTRLLKQRPAPDARTLLLGYRLSRIFSDHQAAVTYSDQLRQLFPASAEFRQLQAEQ